MCSFPKKTPTLCLKMLLCFLAFSLSATGGSQTTPIEGIRTNTPQVHALINARIVQKPDQVIEKGTVVIRDGIIEAVGAEVLPPSDARVLDCEGLIVYPGLIEMYTHLGLRKDGQPDRSGPKHWNSRVHSEENTADSYRPTQKDLDRIRALGFTAALIAPDEGIFRGTSALVSLGDGTTNEQIIRERIAQHIAFSRPRGTGRVYPRSLMGHIALTRQTLLDAQWYRQAHQAYSLKPTGQVRPELNVSLDALSSAVDGKQPVMIEMDGPVNDELSFFRAAKIAEVFDLQLWMRASGYEYRQLQLIKASKAFLVLPVNFPDAPYVYEPEEALSVNLTDLLHWEAAPENPKRLHEAGVTFALTSATLRRSTDFPPRVRQAIEHGLPQDAALAALTTIPAEMLGVEERLGTIEPGKLGHLVVTDGELFAEKTKILDVWVDGRRYEVNEKSDIDLRGKWQLTFAARDEAPLSVTLELKEEAGKLSGTIVKGEIKVKLKRVDLDGKRLSLIFVGAKIGFPGVIRMSGSVEKSSVAGRGEFADGRQFKWTAVFLQPDESPSQSTSPELAKPIATPMLYPPGAFGRIGQPEQPRHVFIQGATIWTSGPSGTLENADMLVTDGKIVEIGHRLTPPAEAVIIDAGEKHITPGLIDAHSHTAMTAGINEGTQAVSAEVRVGDVLNSYDVDLYRQLAGGLTVALVLHGSANPIGGQCAVIKLRWGATPDALKFTDAALTIKFALGENVKRSNWTDPSQRYPQTRMGVEQLIRDRFEVALDYEKGWERYNLLEDKVGVIPPRRDLELKTLLEVLHGERLIHCHSYRQDETLMLVRVAEDFGFTIGAFQHVSEGYKVAEALARHGVGASTFSDRWGYKFEVYDGIPYNGALMHDAGVVVSFNSDSEELARRLNTEAAKAVKYGGVSEEEALKFVTLNPAKQLKIDHRVGSLAPGKDADFVIWNAHPLSTYTRCEQTWIEGRKYFDREEDLRIRKRVQMERSRLIQKVLLSFEKKKEPK